MNLVMRQQEPTQAHDGDWYAADHPESLFWRKPTRQQPFRYCGYCGSIHPVDLVEYALDAEITLEMADWKYGWPHKFYVRGVPNPRAGRLRPQYAYAGDKKVLLERYANTGHRPRRTRGGGYRIQTGEYPEPSDLWVKSRT